MTTSDLCPGRRGYIGHHPPGGPVARRPGGLWLSAPGRDVPGKESLTKAGTGAPLTPAVPQAEDGSGRTSCSQSGRVSDVVGTYVLFIYHRPRPRLPRPRGRTSCSLWTSCSRAAAWWGRLGGRRWAIWPATWCGRPGQSRRGAPKLTEHKIRARLGAAPQVVFFGLFPYKKVQFGDLFFAFAIISRKSGREWPVHTTCGGRCEKRSQAPHPTQSESGYVPWAPLGAPTSPIRRWFRLVR